MFASGYLLLKINQREEYKKNNINRGSEAGYEVGKVRMKYIKLNKTDILITDLPPKTIQINFLSDKRIDVYYFLNQTK